LIATGFTNRRLVDQILNVACAVEEPLSLFQLLANDPRITVPRVFADSVRKDFAEFDPTRVADFDLGNFPPLLRPQVFEPIPANLDGPRLCRFLQNRNILRRELVARIHAENDPRMLHDYLIAHAGFVNLPRELPFRFTLLAVAAVHDSGLVNFFLSEFCKVTPADDAGLVLAAVAGFEVVAARNPDCVSLVFPHVRRLIDCSAKNIRIRLLNAISSAVGDGFLDAEMLWLAYRSIRTVPEAGYHFEDLLHFALVGLADSDDRDVALSWLDVLYKKDRIGVVSGLWRIPPALLPPGEFLPSVAPSYSLKDDPLAICVSHELQNEMTTVRKLQLATAFLVHSELFAQERQEWIRLLVSAGDSVFLMRVETAFCNEVVTKLTAADDLVRFAAAFSIAAFVSYRLITDLKPIAQLLTDVATKDKSSAVRLLALYTLSMCTIEQSLAFVIAVIDRARSAGESKDDLIGVGYCVRAWFFRILPFFQDAGNRRKYGKLRYIWPFINSTGRLLGISDAAIWNENDRLGMAQLIALEHSNERYDAIVDDFIRGVELSDEEAVTAVVGYVPCIAFRINSFDPDERQNRILRAAHGPEHALLACLIGHQRRAHAPLPRQVQAAQAGTTMDRIRQSAETMEPSVLTTLLASLSEAQRDELYRDCGSEAILAVAIHEKSVERVADRLAFRKRAPEVLAKVKEVFAGDINAIVGKMLANGAEILRIAELLVFIRFGELLGDDSNLLMIPALLSELAPPEGIVRAVLRRKFDWTAEFAHCLLLRQPAFFETHDIAFQLFH
jgi:hypothetical protein